MYIIVNYNAVPDHINITRDEDGEALLFDDEITAKHFAIENCTGYFKIVKL